MSRSKSQKRALAALNYDLFRLEDSSPPAPATLYTKIRHHAQPAPVEISADELKLTCGQLPSLAQLYRMFDVYNWTYFRGRLPRVSIEYSHRMTSAGSYVPDRGLIRIGRKYHEIFPDEIYDTLKHEMIHIRHLNHDASFKAVARCIGASVRARSHPALRKPPRYIYVCPSCGARFPRQKRFRMASCGHCTPGRQFDPRFKLRLLKSNCRKN